MCGSRPTPPPPHHPSAHPPRLRLPAAHVPDALHRLVPKVWHHVAAEHGIRAGDPRRSATRSHLHVLPLLRERRLVDIRSSGLARCVFSLPNPNPNPFFPRCHTRIPPRPERHSCVWKQPSRRSTPKRTPISAGASSTRISTGRCCRGGVRAGTRAERRAGR